MASVDLYSGRHWLGTINETAPSRFEAAPASGPSFGIFPSYQAAAQSILAHGANRFRVANLATRQKRPLWKRPRRRSIGAKVMSAPIGDNRLPLLAAEINQHIAAARRHSAASLASALAAGERLIEAKVALGHGAWLPWLNTNCALSERTAQVYMRLARNVDAVGKSAGTADLTIEAAVDALVTPRQTAPASYVPAWGQLLIGELEGAETWIMPAPTGFSRAVEQPAVGVMIAT